MLELEKSNFPILSVNKLCYLLGTEKADLIRIAEHAGKYYKPFDVKKARTTKWRHIDNPKEHLKSIQKKIQKKLLSSVVLPDTMIGGVPGKSIFENASFHTKKPTVITLDLRDCFPRTGHVKVFNVFKNQLRCSTEVSSILTKLTTFETRLPQGAPTSSLLANFTLMPLHDAVGAIAKRNNYQWSFYVDDVVISGLGCEKSLEEIIKSIQKAGHAIKRTKIKIMPAHIRQRVTSLVVNAKVSLARDYLENTRREIIDLSCEEKASPVALASVWGKIKHIKRVCFPRGKAIERLAKELIDPAPKKYKKAKNNDQYRPCKNTHRHVFYRNAKYAELA
jgi:hypothetical protein